MVGLQIHVLHSSCFDACYEKIYNLFIFVQEPEHIDWELYKKSIGSGIVGMHKQAHDGKVVFLFLSSSLCSIC